MIDNEKQQNISDLIAKICYRYGITEEQLKSPRRLNLLVKARIDLSKTLRKMGLSYSSIAMLLGNRDHTTVIHYLRRKKRKKRKMKLNRAK